MSAKGSCLCGKITLSIAALDRDVIACHCVQCRKQSGHHYAAARAKNNDITVDGEEHVKWFRSSSDAERGFCRHCGSALFWRHDGTEHTSILAGCLDTPTGLKISRHIFTADKGDYYELTDGAEVFTQGD